MKFDSVVVSCMHSRFCQIVCTGSTIGIPMKSIFFHLNHWLLRDCNIVYKALKHQHHHKQ